ncbi:pilus assembly protein [Marinicellulosiphila megalodicopiae]|uniref:pilus assembly protein n=1 Tax=Marinicellulosiphila megalodicopiae TaxID=2724896 RepID=UPI003BAE4DD6
MKKWLVLVVLTFWASNGMSRNAYYTTNEDFSAMPVLLSSTSTPLVMLAMSVDHQLFIKAYSDYSDNDGDGVLDTTYDDLFNYYGYFDSEYCYKQRSYVFYPSSTIDDYPNSVGHTCSQSNDWSGNFLNWATMTRLDIVRKVLYGGKRSTDTSTTILERAHLPMDGHAFAKVFSSSSMTDYTPYNKSTITMCNLSNEVVGDMLPVMLVADGSYPRWATSEKWQCNWNGTSRAPLTEKIADDIVIRVSACENDYEGLTADKCKEYPNGEIKPVGLLQLYGETGDIEFGLITGSHAKPDQGGMVRSNISKIAGNDDPNENEVNTANGRFTTKSGIISNIDALRMVGVEREDSNFHLNCSAYGISIDTYLTSTSSSRLCSDWGNPISEIYLEALRYFSGLTPTTVFLGEDDDIIEGLTHVDNWSDPLSDQNNCAQCSIIVLSTGLNSFDADDLDGASDLNGITSRSHLSEYTDNVGDLEMGDFTDYNYLNGGDNKAACESTDQSSTTVELSDMEGVCPEVPVLQGSYELAGLAHYAKTKDLRSLLDNSQSINTYAVQLAQSLPSFEVVVDDAVITILPACKTNNSPCSFLNVDVIEQTESRGNLVFYWEDSLWGGDYDLDTAQRIEYCVGSACGDSTENDEIRITNTMLSKSTPEIAVNYSLTGTRRNDGISNSLWVESSDGNFSAFAGEVSNIEDQPESKTARFEVGNSDAKLLPNPLWFASKYGGFNDLDGDGTPKNINGDDSEWDSIDNLTGLTGSDGIPDNYFHVINPSELERQLANVFDTIINRTSSGTNAAVVASKTDGVGAVYQALFQPTLTVNEHTINWGGMLHALFIDQYGNVREDTDLDNQLTLDDKVITMYFDAIQDQTMVLRYDIDNYGVITRDASLPQPIDSLKHIWDARDQLARVPSPSTQREYSFENLNRHILTSIGGQVKAFTSDVMQSYQRYFAISNPNFGWQPSDSDITDFVNYIRGEENYFFRSRVIDWDGLGEKVWRLGDIIHSTPLVVGAPNGNYDSQYNDVSYEAYVEKYKNRRQMVYVGANDGMIHAFNGGFWNQPEHKFETSAAQIDSSLNYSEFELGSELWAYIPENTLPHLRWLAYRNYQHVYYIDGEPQSFDVKIFDNDETHPNGWGTILVVGMRLGGSEVTVEVESGVEQDFQSSYIVLDITNPEIPPTLIAEINDFDAQKLGLTVSKPALVKANKTVNGVDVNRWMLAFASGPTGDESHRLSTSDQNTHVYFYDLSASTDHLSKVETSYTFGYGGDVTSVDLDNDYVDDVLYFGNVNAEYTTSIYGELVRVQLNLMSDISPTNYGKPTNISINTMLDTERPVVAAPHFVIDEKGENWILFGTGRLHTINDNLNTQQQYFIGIKEEKNNSFNYDYSEFYLSDLINTSDVTLYSDDTILSNNSTIEVQDEDSNTIELDTFYDLKGYIQSQHGWYIELDNNSTDPTGRNISKATNFSELVFFTQYQPPANTCKIDGTSILYGLDFTTGTASLQNPFYSEVPDEDSNDSPSEIGAQMSLGIGLASAPVIHLGEAGQVSVLTQSATGAIETTSINYEFDKGTRLSWKYIY